MTSISRILAQMVLSVIVSHSPIEQVFTAILKFSYIGKGSAWHMRVDSHHQMNFVSNVG